MSIRGRVAFFIAVIAFTLGGVVVGVVLHTRGNEQPPVDPRDAQITQLKKKLEDGEKEKAIASAEQEHFIEEVSTHEASGVLRGPAVKDVHVNSEVRTHLN